MRWTLVAAALATATLFATAPADAQTYPGCATQFSDVTVEPGQTISITGTNAQPGEDVVATIDGRAIGRGVVDGNGDFSFSAVIPADLASGVYSVQVSCGPTGATLDVETTVGPPTSTPAGGELPRTGSGSTMPLTRIAVGLVTVGGLAVLMSRRRSTAEARPARSASGGHQPNANN